MGENSIEARAALHDSGFSQYVNLYFRRVTDGRQYVAEPLSMSFAEAGSMVDPACRLDQTSAQELMDDLWRCGLRPSEGSGSAGQLSATERHLSDMRRLVFKEAE